MSSKSKHAVITGGANGIGRCITETFLHSDIEVTLIDIDKIAGEKLQIRFPEIQFFHGDIGEKNILDKFVETIGKPVDFLINNACVSRKGILSGCSWEDFDLVQRVGVIAPYYLTKLLYQKKLLSFGASIVNIASTRAYQSQKDTESYTAAKGGLIALTHAMSVSLSGHARVNSISPGWIETYFYQKNIEYVEQSPENKIQHPAGRIGLPEDIAEMALFLCSEKAGFITGENISVDGGMSKLMIYHDDHGWEFKTERCPYSKKDKE
ncbi:MAG: SDR family oxidoreductase [Candidatus Cloacimonetes bacterium]|nr:SDR family oxidoreductase [Candidatus Cloacimonadota bacterium]